MNSLTELLKSITPDIYENLKRAIELGKWPNGQALDKEQRALCMQAVISYEHEHLKAEKHTGFIPPKPHESCSEPLASENQPLTWVDNQ